MAEARAPERLPDLLAAVPETDRTRLLSKTERVRLEIADVLYERDEPFRHAWFPIDCVASLMVFVGNGKTIEAGLVGREGVVGLPLLLGAETTPNRGDCQTPGEALRIRAADFRQEASAPGPFRDALLRYAHAHFTQAAQSAGCNASHALLQRCARWLLMSHDRAGRDTFALTHEYLAIMLGTRRASVSEAMETLRDRGALTYHRGAVAVRDRAALEAASCVCYGIIKREYDRLVREPASRA